MSLVGEPLPGGTAPVETYLDIWTEFGEADFDLDDLVRRVIEREAGDPPSRDDLRAQLDVLVACGLLRWDGRDRFQVWCKPEESVDGWRTKLEPRTAVVHDRVREAMERRDLPRTSEESVAGVLQYGGETYASTFVDVEDPSFEEQLAFVVDALDPDSGNDHAGVVFRTPGDVAASVQRLADRLCDRATMAETSCPYRFEKETSRVVGDDADDLEYRLFLRETSGND